MQPQQRDTSDLRNPLEPDFDNQMHPTSQSSCTIGRLPPLMAAPLTVPTQQLSPNACSVFSALPDQGHPTISSAGSSFLGTSESTSERLCAAPSSTAMRTAHLSKTAKRIEPSALVTVCFSSSSMYCTYSTNSGRTWGGHHNERKHLRTWLGRMTAVVESVWALPPLSSTLWCTPSTA